MQLGMIGLGRMGANMVRRQMREGHVCVVFDLNPENVEKLAKAGATAAATLDAFTAALKPLRHCWVTVPSGAATESTVNELAKRLQGDDTIIDRGNSSVKDDVRRAKGFAPSGLHAEGKGGSAAFL